MPLTAVRSVVVNNSLSTVIEPICQSKSESVDTGFYRIRLCPLKVYFLKYWEVVWSSRSIIVIWSYSPYCRMSVLLIRCWEVRPLLLVHWWNNFCPWKLTLCRTIISGCPIRPSVFPLLVHSLFSWVKPVGHFINFNFKSIFMWPFHVYLCSSYYRSPSTRVVVCLKLSQLICLQVYDLLSTCAPIEYSAVVQHSTRTRLRQLLFRFLPRDQESVGAYMDPAFSS